MKTRKRLKFRCYTPAGSRRRRLEKWQHSGKAATAAGHEKDVVPASEYRALQHQVREFVCLMLILQRSFVLRGLLVLEMPVCNLDQMGVPAGVSLQSVLDMAITILILNLRED